MAKNRLPRFQRNLLLILIGLMLGVLVGDLGRQAGSALFGDDVVLLHVDVKGK